MLLRDVAMAYDTAIVELSGNSIDELNSLLNFPNGMEEEEGGGATCMIVSSLVSVEF